MAGSEDGAANSLSIHCWTSSSGRINTGLPSELNRLSSDVETRSGAAQPSRQSRKSVKKMVGKLDEKRLTDLTEGVAVHGTRDHGGGGQKEEDERFGTGETERDCVVDVYSSARMRRRRVERGKGELSEENAEVVESKVWRVACPKVGSLQAQSKIQSLAFFLLLLSLRTDLQISQISLHLLP